VCSLLGFVGVSDLLDFLLEEEKYFHMRLGVIQMREDARGIFK